jgi:hypothetical protein
VSQIQQLKSATHTNFQAFRKAMYRAEDKIPIGWNRSEKTENNAYNPSVGNYVQNNIPAIRAEDLEANNQEILIGNEQI